jgi:hypothetical protein
MLPVYSLESLAKDMTSIDAGYMAVSALVTGLLASGISPEKVAGYAALGFVPAVGKLLRVSNVVLSGISTEAWIAVSIVLMAAIATGTVLDVKACRLHTPRTQLGDRYVMMQCVY